MGILESLPHFLPETFLLICAFGLVFLDLFLKNKKVIGLLAVLALIGTGLLAKMPAVSQPLFFGFFTLDAFTHYFRLLSLGVIAVTLLISLGYKRLAEELRGEYYSLFLFMAFALTLAAASTNLLMLFMSIEFISILSYLLTGFLKKDPRAKEAALKYFLFGSLASGIMLYGMSLLYGMAGSIEFGVIQHALQTTSGFRDTAVISLLCFLTGLGFKISMAPFHMWAPDVYEAVPTPVTGFLTVAPKALGFAVMLRLLATAFLSLGTEWQTFLVVFSILTMTIGNFMAIAQTNVKRLLAFSSVAQAGYILMGAAIFNDLGITGVLIYLMAYAFTNLGAFAVVTAAGNALGDDELLSYSGLSKRSPFLAAALTLFLVSLAGLPPFAGFIGKFYVFSAALQGGFIKFAVIAAINSAVAAFYYFKIVRMMYLVNPVREEKIIQPAGYVFVISLLLAGVFLLGLYPAPFIHFVKGMLLV